MERWGSRRLTRSVRLTGLLASLALVFAVTPRLSAQEFATTVYLGLGPAENGLNAALGARLDVYGKLGGYARVGLRGGPNNCETSLPMTCNYPYGESYELAAGLTYPVVGERWHLLMGAGGGVLSWQDGLDPFVDLSFEARRQLNSHFALMLGMDGIYAPRVERKRNGNNPIVPKRSVLFPVMMAGVVFGL